MSAMFVKSAGPQLAILLNFELRINDRRLGSNLLQRLVVRLSFIKRYSFLKNIL